MNNIQEVNTEAQVQVNATLGSQDNAMASRKLGSAKAQSPMMTRQRSMDTDLTKENASPS